MSRESRLWRKLGAKSPMFRAWNSRGVELFDHDITAIKISRGSDGPEDGIHTQTATIDTISFDKVRAGEPIVLDLTSYGQTRLRTLCGTHDAIVKPRFFGRIGRQAVNDVKPGVQQTTYSCASWEAQLNHIDAARNYSAGEPVADWIMRLGNGGGVGTPVLPVWNAPAPASHYGHVRESSEAPVTFKDDFKKWTADIGLYIQTRRDGTNHILSHQYRWEQALAKLASTYYPITRSQAVSPATWEQPAEDIPMNHRVDWYNTAGPTYQRWGPDPDNTSYAYEEYDLTHVRWWTNEKQPINTGKTYYNRNVLVQYRLPSLTFDVLRLLNSPHESHRDQARQLLELEPGDPVFLAGDWYQQLQGIQFAVGIDESITPDGWEITLNLADSREVVGEVSPEVPARTWEAAWNRWETEPRPNNTWNKS